MQPVLAVISLSAMAAIATAAATSPEQPRGPDADQPRVLQITSADDGPAHFTVTGSAGGGARLLRSAAVHLRTVDGVQQWTITTPAALELPAGTVFDLTLVALEGSPELEIVLNTADNTTTIIRGDRLGFARTQQSGNVHVTRSRFIEHRGPGH